MTDQVAVSESIHAPAAVLYGLVSDVTRMGEWSPETVKCRWLDGAGAPEVGAKFAGTNKAKARRWSTHCQITAAEPARRFAFHVSFATVPIADWTYDFAAAEGGGTLVTETWTDRRPAWMRMLSGPVMGISDRASHNEKGMRTTLQRLKQAGEMAATSA